MTTYIVIAKCWGDGETHPGIRVWSHDFQTKDAAQEAFDFLSQSDLIRVKLIEDRSRRRKHEPSPVST